jgi:hypothetical protein
VVGGRFCQDHLDYLANYSRQKGEIIKVVSLPEWEIAFAETEMGRQSKEGE